MADSNELDQISEIVEQAASVVLGLNAIKIHIALDVTSDPYKRHTAKINFSQTISLGETDSGQGPEIGKVYLDAARQQLNVVAKEQLKTFKDWIAQEQADALADMPPRADSVEWAGKREDELRASPITPEMRARAAQKVTQQRMPMSANGLQIGADGRMSRTPKADDLNAETGSVVPGNWCVEMAHSWELSQGNQDGSWKIAFSQDGLKFPVGRLSSSAPSDVLDAVVGTLSAGGLNFEKYGKGRFTQPVYLVMQVGNKPSPTTNQYYLDITKAVFDKAVAVPYTTATEQRVASMTTQGVADDDDITF